MPSDTDDTLRGQPLLTPALAHAVIARARSAVAAVRLLDLTIFAISLFIVASTLRLVVASWHAFPVTDQWDELVTGRRITAEWLFSQHNEHRLALPRLIFIADRWLAQETNIVDLAINLLMQAALAAILVLLARRPGRSLLWTAGLVLAPLFWAAQWENFAWGFQVQFFGVVLGAASCFALLALGRHTPQTAFAVAALALATAYTLSSGILAAFIALPLAAWLGRPKPYLAILAIAAIIGLGSYLIGYQTPDAHSDPADAIFHLFGVLDYLAVEIGGPVGNALGTLLHADALPIAHLAGWLGVCGFGVLALDRSRRRPVDARAAALLALGAFVVGMALLTGAGRLRFGVMSAVASRYATPAAVFWLVLAWLAVEAAPARMRTLLPVPLLLLILASQGDFTRIALGASRYRAAALPALLAGVDDAEMLRHIHPDAAVPLAHRAALQAAHTSIFAQPWANWLGTPLQDHLRLANPDDCRGSIDATEPLPAAAIRLHGTMTVPADGTPRKLLLADAAGTIIGYGLTGFPAADAWIGAAREAPPTGIRAFVLLRSDTEACLLGR